MSELFERHKAIAEAIANTERITLVDERGILYSFYPDSYDVTIEHGVNGEVIVFTDRGDEDDDED